jgi:hypothetical protein
MIRALFYNHVQKKALQLKNPNFDLPWQRYDLEQNAMHSVSALLGKFLSEQKNPAKKSYRSQKSSKKS